MTTHDFDSGFSKNRRKGSETDWSDDASPIFGEIENDELPEAPKAFTSNPKQEVAQANRRVATDKKRRAAQVQALTKDVERWNANDFRTYFSWKALKELPKLHVRPSLVNQPAMAKHFARLREMTANALIREAIDVFFDSEEFHRTRHPTWKQFIFHTDTLLIKGQESLDRKRTEEKYECYRAGEPERLRLQAIEDARLEEELNNFNRAATRKEREARMAEVKRRSKALKQQWAETRARNEVIRERKRQYELDYFARSDSDKEDKRRAYLVYLAALAGVQPYAEFLDKGRRRVSEKAARKFMRMLDSGELVLPLADIQKWDSKITEGWFDGTAYPYDEYVARKARVAERAKRRRERTPEQWEAIRVRKLEKERIAAEEKVIRDRELVARFHKMEWDNRPYGVNEW